MINLYQSVEEIRAEQCYRDYLFAARNHARRCQMFQLFKPPTPRYAGTTLAFVPFDSEISEITGEEGFWRIRCNVHGRIFSTLDGAAAVICTEMHDLFGHE